MSLKNYRERSSPREKTKQASDNFITSRMQRDGLHSVIVRFVLHSGMSRKHYSDEVAPQKNSELLRVRLRRQTVLGSMFECSRSVISISEQ